MEVIDTLTQKYVNYYRQMHMNPNLTPSKHNGTETAKNEHTMNIRAGLAVLKTMYSMHMDEYDYIDIAVDTLRNIKHFGATEYVSYITVDPSGKAHLPCNIDTIDAVYLEMGRKACY
jgi:hypothetical protein